MYIDPILTNFFKKRYGEKDIIIALDNCGIWYSLDGIRAEEEDFDKTLEETMADYYYIIIDNKIKFCSPEQFLRDCDELF